MQTFIGSVVSTKNLKTATVLIRRRYRHPLYGKSVNVTKKYSVHDEIGVQVGDTVKFTPCRPISKSKRWKILEVVIPRSVEAAVAAEGTDAQVTETKTQKAAAKKTAVKKTTDTKKAAVKAEKEVKPKATKKAVTKTTKKTTKK